MSDVQPTDTRALNEVDDALCCASPVLTHEEQHLAVAIYRLLAAGKPVPTAAIAQTVGMPERRVEALIDERPAIYRDDDGRIIGFWGLTTEPMAHRVQVDGTELSTWCAWDPLFLTLILGPMSVTTTDPVSGETITYRTDGKGGLQALSHPNGRLSFLRPTARWGQDVITTFCHYVLQFTTAATAEQWIAEHPGTFLLSFDQAGELARRHVERTFGAALSGQR